MALPPDNPDNGLRYMEIDGTVYTLRLKWSGVAQIRRAYPEGYNLADPEHLAVILAVSMAENHPDMTADRIMDLSPPLEKAIEAASDVINYSWWGQKSVPERKEEEGRAEANPRKKRIPETTA